MSGACSTQKVALITGSATGIGANVAVDLASSGYFIIVTGRDQARLHKIIARCNKVSPSANPSAVSFRADLFDFKQVDQLIHFIGLKFNRLDVLVNNACWRGGVHKDVTKTDGHISGSNDGTPFEDFQRVMHVNVSVPMYLIQRCLLPMSQRNNRSEIVVVLNVSSTASHSAVPLHSYSISKACLSEMSRQMAQLGGRLGICSVTISPGPVLTDERPHHQAMRNMTLVNRVGTTQEISNLVLFAIENANLFNGQEIYIDGGYLAKQRQNEAAYNVNG